MNLPNKITMSRIFLSLIIILLLLFPFDAMGFSLPKLFINETIVVDIKYLIAGVLFIIASLTDFVDGHLARKYKFKSLLDFKKRKLDFFRMVASSKNVDEKTKEMAKRLVSIIRKCNKEYKEDLWKYYLCQIFTVLSII